MNSLIAAKLNVLETAIVRIEEWTHVLFVVVKGLGARFVSKKIVEVKKMTSADCMTKKYSVNEIIVTHYNSGAWIIVNTATGQIVNEYQGTAREMNQAHRDYAKAQVLEFKSASRPTPIKHKTTRRTCLNCDISGLFISTRGYCTDCDGEC